ncbi:MAG: hypothetical protein AAF481_18135 [Acidobacteriota bacterium]
MIQHFALVFLCLASPLLLASLILGGRWGEIVFLVLSLLFPLALIALGLRRDRAAGAVGWMLGGLAVVLLGSAGAMVFATGAEQALVAGLPLGGALMLYGMGLLPLLLVPWIYAVTFRCHGLTEEDLRSLRSLRSRDGE